MHDETILMRGTKASYYDTFTQTTELEEWKEKSRQLRTNVDSLKAKYDQLLGEHEKMKEVYAQCDSKRDSCMQEEKKLSSKVAAAVSSNRELKGQLLEAERYN